MDIRRGRGRQRKGGHRDRDREYKDKKDIRRGTGSTRTRRT